MMTTDWMMELEDSRTSGLWFEINGVDAGELLDFILAKDAEIERLREENQKQKEQIMLLNSLVQTEHKIIRAALKGDE